MGAVSLLPERNLIKVNFSPNMTMDPNCYKAKMANL